jgi:hypothetical protein
VTEKSQSRTERAKEILQQEEENRNNWQQSAMKNDAKLEMWIGKPVKNHVRVLLCTLNDILWPDCGWERVAMHEVMDNDSIRKVHRKYITRLHPDKVIQTNDPDKIYLANRVFTAITDAYNLFRKENGLK